MVTPFPEFHAEPVWKKYLEQRIRLEARQTYSPPLPGTKISRYNVFSESHDAPFDILCKAGINESFGNWFCDGVLVVHGEYYNTPRETTGKVFVRIYPLHTLNMIEIGFYHHKVRGNEREPHFKYDGCALGFRYVLPDEEPYTYAMIRTLFTRSMRKMFLPERNGFTNIYYGNQHRGRPDENDSEWSGSRGSLGIDGDDLDLLNDAFQLPDTFKSNRTMAWKKVAFKRALACRFLLSTVTVDPGVDSFGRVNEKLMGNAIGPFPWVLGGVDNWFARKVSFWCRGKWGRTKWKDTIEIRG